MSQTIKFELDRSGVRELLRSDEMMEICREYADKAADRLGDGYEVSEYTGRNRVNASVAAVSGKARKENSDNNTILKAVNQVD